MRKAGLHLCLYSEIICAMIGITIGWNTTQQWLREPGVTAIAKSGHNT